MQGVIPLTCLVDNLVCRQQVVTSQEDYSADKFLCVVLWAVCLWTISQQVIGEHVQCTENRKLPSFTANRSKNLIVCSMRFSDEEVREK